MGAFRSIGQIHKSNGFEGGDTLINIGIDVHKKMCVATIKGNGKDIIEQT